MVETMPSPTRAMIVSSVAPPISPAMLVRTVARALASSWMPSLATAAMRAPASCGQSMMRGLTQVCTASSTLRPARSMPAAALNGSWMLARSAAISARTTFRTLPPAR